MTRRYRHDDHDSYIKWGRFDTQSITVGMKGSFGCVVHGAVDVGYSCSDATNVDDGVFCLHQERIESLAHSHDGDDIGVEDVLYLHEVDVERWDSIIAACIVD